VLEGGITLPAGSTTFISLSKANPGTAPTLLSPVGILNDIPDMRDPVRKDLELSKRQTCQKPEKFDA
jgi:hypothetical protein